MDANTYMVDGRETGAVCPKDSVSSAVAYWVLLFASASIAGWVYETVYGMLFLGGFHLRASLAGPWCPVYGAGAVVATALFGGWAQVRREGVLAKAGSAVACAAGMFVLFAAVEFLAAVVCTATMGYVPWDYSDSPGNLMGVVAPPYTLVFVAGAMPIVYLFAPWLRGKCAENPRSAVFLAASFAVPFAVDVALEAAGVWDSVLPRDPVPDDAPKADLLQRMREMGLWGEECA